MKQPISATPGHNLSASRCAAVVAAAALILSACSMDKVPRFRYDPDGEPVQYKRYEKHVAVDYLFHFTPVAFQRTDALPLDPLLSDDQKNVLDQQGKPEYLRANYTSDSKETVTDWAYVSKHKIFQFVQGQLVYSGDLSDYDDQLIRRGRPNRVVTVANKDFGRTDVFYYTDLITQKTEQYGFKEGVLAGKTMN